MMSELVHAGDTGEKSGSHRVVSRRTWSYAEGLQKSCNGGVQAVREPAL